MRRAETKIVTGKNVTGKHGFAFAKVRRKQKPRSCLEAWEQGARASGFFCIQDNDGHLHKVYCDLASEPGWVWTLITSQSLRNREEQFAQAGLLVDSPKNAELPNWQAYRLPLNRMVELKSRSTHWRVTCSFPSQGVDYRDYLRVEFERFDVLTFVAGRVCKQVEYIDIRGHVCQQCTTAWGQKIELFLTHRSDVNECDRGSTPDHISSEQSFGRYKKGRNPEFRCTSEDSSTTNYWFGSRLKP
ncbi:hypothetical protein OS493_018932 [Desmophyllum pertusum]|uniref:Uncharacterized protein n=1 Tax=Desmophyllum pertusum TaxID=174260 RepID=A0A9W9Z3B0_9CNID|nr:hypothetical protein OS493_018932 [Desmophyllum pertusum]